MNTAAASPHPLPSGNRLMFPLGLAMLAGICVYFAYSWSGTDLLHLYLGEAMLILAALPALVWVRQKQGSFPLMEVFMLTTANIYAVPLLSGHEALGMYSDEVISQAALAVIMYQTGAIATFLLVRGRPKIGSFWQEEIISEEFSKFLPYGLTATTVYSVISTFYNDALFSHLPHETEGILRAAFIGLGNICTFITCRRWGLGLLRSGEKLYFAINLLLQFLVLSSSFLLIMGLSTLVLALLGYVSGSRRVPIAVLAVCLPLIAILHNGKSAMRERHWVPGAPLPTLTSLPAIYQEWFQLGLQRADDSRRSTASKLFDRTSLFQIICLVVDRTPSRQPFLSGETYYGIPGQFIPRFFWPDKPVAHASTYRLSIYYGLQDEESTKTTTIGFGMLSEAYANFGLFGATLLGVFFGAFFRKISRWSEQSPMLSYGGLLLILFMAWSFQTELTLSIWLSSLFQACVAVLGIPLLVRSFLS